MNDMKLSRPLSLLAALAITASTFAAAPSRALADFKVATVDVNRVLNESKTAKAKRKELDDMTARAKKKVEDRREALKAMESKLKESGVKDDSKEAEQFRTQAKDFTRMVKDSEEELKREFLKVNRTLTDSTLKAVSDYAQKNNIDIVLEAGAQGRGGAVLYGSPSFDITDSVIKQLNQ